MPKCGTLTSVNKGQFLFASNGKFELSSIDTCDRHAKQGVVRHKFRRVSLNLMMEKIDGTLTNST